MPSFPAASFPAAPAWPWEEPSLSELQCTAGCSPLTQSLALPLPRPGCSPLCQAPLAAGTLRVCIMGHLLVTSLKMYVFLPQIFVEHLLCVSSPVLVAGSTMTVKQW